MNFLFTQSSVVDIQCNVVKISRQNNKHYGHIILSGHEPLGQSVYFIFVTWVARAVVVAKKLEMASENLWQRGFDEWGKRRKLLE